MDVAVAAAAAVADYCSNGEEGGGEAGAKCVETRCGGGTVASIQCGVAMCRAAPAESIGIPRRRFSPPSSRRALLQLHGEKKREREREGGKATGEGRDGTKGRENVKLPPLFSGALFAGRADWTGLAGRLFTKGAEG